MNMHVPAPTQQSDHDELVAFCEKMGDPLPKFLTMADLRKPWYEAAGFLQIELLTYQQGESFYPAPSESLMVVLGKRFMRKRKAYRALCEQMSDLYWEAILTAHRVNGEIDFDGVEAIKAKNGYVSVRDERRRVEPWLFKEARRILRYHPASALGLTLLKDIELFVVMFDRPPVGARPSTTAAA
ncbi:hypothetical protein KHC28_11265 [Ancylobacter sonchi]|uniref:hypothetical protein n=1 Tax=Ancylobacter sonchi TaxID=1937790 RepID=UPI001BD63420|nr:hypothetical protein [Ancylobacter sonchi]MBS7534237.1 hypothetical protein [Ancylobacter sonchi]